MFSLFLFIFHLFLPHAVQSNTFPYYRCFTGLTTAYYENVTRSDDVCNPGEDCTTSLQGYNGWSTNTSGYSVFNNTLGSSSSSEFFGFDFFGRWNLVTKTFTTLPVHNAVLLVANVSVSGWTSNILTVKVDDVTKEYTIDGSTMTFISILTAHTSISLTIIFQSSLNVAISTKTWGIKDFMISLTNDCPASCWLCNGAACTKCPFFSILNSSSLCECMDGFIMNPGSYCEPCDISCKTCSGTGPNECLSCYQNYTFNSSTGACDRPISLFNNLI